MQRPDLSALPARPVTRFAPSPTGLLHLGHVANAVWTWGLARAAGGRVILRIEDHDRGRSREGFEAAIREDLAWLGLESDAESAGSLAGPPPSAFRQSDCAAIYAASLARLREVARVFACRCSRKAIAAASEGPARERRYPGTCRDRNIEEIPGRGVRLVLPAGSVRFQDVRHGAVVQAPADQCGDLLLRDPSGSWTYQFAVVVDDIRQGVNLVVRGDDLLDSTGRQIMLAGMLGRSEPPAFLHHPLIFGDQPGVKLSKRDDVAGVASLRAAGRSAEDVLGLAAHGTGLLPAPRPVSAEDLGGLFT